MSRVSDLRNEVKELLNTNRLTLGEPIEIAALRLLEATGRKGKSSEEFKVGQLLHMRDELKKHFKI